MVFVDEWNCVVYVNVVVMIFGLLFVLLVLVIFDWGVYLVVVLGKCFVFVM